MIDVRSLSYIYNQDTPYRAQVIKDLSLTIQRGEIIAVIGPGGSGKSCLLRCLAGVLSPTAGEILLETNDLLSTQLTGLIIQEPESQLFKDTVYQEVAFALENRGVKPLEIKRIVTETLARVGYHGDLNQSPFQLSGGEQRRVALAGMLVMDPQILLWDEPTVGLDATGLEMVGQIISNFRKRAKIVIIVSHDLDFLYRQVDRYLVLNQGKLIADFIKTDFNRNIGLLKRLGLTIPELIELEERKIPIDIKNELIKLKEFES